MVKVSNNTKSREQLFIRLYQEVFPAVAKIVHQNGGTLDEAKDVFQDALVAYYENVISGHWKEHSIAAKNAYLFAIGRNMWYHKSKDNKYSHQLGPASIEQEIDTKSLHPSQEKLLQLLEVAGKKCLDLLQTFYYHKTSMQKLASKFGYSSVRSATVQKHKCLEKVRDKIKEKNIAYEDFLE